MQDSYRYQVQFDGDTANNSELNRTGVISHKLFLSIDYVASTDGTLNNRRDQSIFHEL